MNFKKFQLVSPFSGFSFQSNPHSEDPFLILGKTGFHNRLYIWIINSQEHHKRA